MSNLSLEWLIHLFRCVPWHRCSVRVVGLDDLRLADELIDFGEELPVTRS